MKYFAIAIYLVFLIFTEPSCKKTITQTDSLVGKWSIVSDSSCTINSCSSCYNGSKYVGIPSDYYIFTGNGTLYVDEQTALDTAKYSMITNNQVNIVTDFAVNDGGVFIYSLRLTGFNGPDSYPIKNLTYSVSNITAHTATLTTSGAFTFPTSGLIQYLEIINLKKIS